MTTARSIARDWQDIVETMIHPLEAALDGAASVDKNAFIATYTRIYQLIASGDDFARMVYDGCAARIGQYLSSVVVVALDRTLRAGASPLEEFKRRKDNHDLMMRWYRAVFLPLERNFLPKHRLSSIPALGAQLYKEIVFRNFSGAIAREVLRALETVGAAAADAASEDSVLRGCVGIFLEMGLYHEFLERSVLRHCGANCREKAARWMAEDSVSVYLRKVQRELDGLSRIVASFLPRGTEPKLWETVRAEMVAPYVSALAEKDTGCMFLFERASWDDVALMYRTFSDVRDTHALFALWTRFVQSQIAARAIAPFERGGGDEKEAGYVFVTELLCVWEEFGRVTTEVYGGSAVFWKTLRDSFTLCLRKAADARAVVEALCVFCDRELKRKITTQQEEERELERRLDGAVLLLGFLDDKDLFFELYRLQLARRLLLGGGATDMERTMVTKLKVAFGAQITLPLEGMVKDVSAALDMGATTQLLQTRVLTAGHWPRMLALEELRLPPAMRALQTEFEARFARSHSSRRLTWIHSHGSVELLMRFPGGPQTKKTYTLDLSPPQAVVLLAFTDAAADGSGPLSFAELQQRTNLSEDVLKKLLHSLACAKHKLLLNESTPGAKGVKPTDVFRVNCAFSSPQTRFKVPMPSLEPATGAAKQTVDLNRTYQIEAAAVRIMKARKSLTHQALVSEVLSQLALFKPDPKTIKKTIESLIERDYLSRNEDSPGIYHYVA